jgi:hypothetical protein
MRVTEGGVRSKSITRLRHRRLNRAKRYVLRFRASGALVRVRPFLMARGRPVKRARIAVRYLSLCGGQVNAAQWIRVGTNAPQGWTLRIYPSPCGRATGLVNATSMLSEAVRATSERVWKPGLNQHSMLTQLQCHGFYTYSALFKDTWNLDGWRPDVSLAAMLTAWCNPGPDSPPGGGGSSGGPPPGPGPSVHNEYAVMNTSETPPDGVWFRNSPHTGDTDRVTGHGVYAGERVRLLCYAWGDSVGAYSNRVWYRVTNVTRPSNAGRANDGFLSAHYINDGLAANQVDAGVPAC